MQGLRQVRGIALVTGAVLLAQAVLLAIVGGAVALPFVLDLRGASGGPRRVELGDVNGVHAVAVALALAGLARLALLLPRVRAGFDRALAAGRHDLRWVEWALAWPIVTVVVALLNGVSDAGAVILVYAMTAGWPLLHLLQERLTMRSGDPRLALVFGSAVGVVPWGMIAVHQIGAGLAGDPPTGYVRVVTLVVLAVAFAVFALGLREQHPRRPLDAVRGERLYWVGEAVALSLFAWSLVLLG